MSDQVLIEAQRRVTEKKGWLQRGKDLSQNPRFTDPTREEQLAEHYNGNHPGTFERCPICNPS